MKDNSSKRYIDCPLCGEMFSYYETSVKDDGDHIFITCPHCKSDFVQPIADPINIFDEMSFLQGAMTAPVDGENILEMFEREYGQVEEASEESFKKEKEAVEETKEQDS